MMPIPIISLEKILFGILVFAVLFPFWIYVVSYAYSKGKARAKLEMIEQTLKTQEEN